MIDIRADDVTGDAVLALLALHLAGMHASSPPEAVFALDTSGLRAADVSVWTAWHSGKLLGIGALKALGADHGEVKSMRTHPAHLRKGVAAALLTHIVEVASARRYARLSLETGTTVDFAAGHALYHRFGFVDGEPFADYKRNAFSRFMHLDL